MSNAIIESVPSTHTGEATSVNSIVRTIGGSVGTAVVAVIAANSTAHGLPTDAAFTNGFWVCAGVGVLSVVVALALPSARRRHQVAAALGVEDLPPEPEELHLHVPRHLPHPHRAEQDG